MRELTHLTNLATLTSGGQDSELVRLFEIQVIRKFQENLKVWSVKTDPLQVFEVVPVILA